MTSSVRGTTKQTETHVYRIMITDAAGNKAEAQCDARVCIPVAPGMIALAMPVKFSINFPTISLSNCWQVDQPTDGRITADVMSTHVTFSRIGIEATGKHFEQVWTAAVRHAGQSLKMDGDHWSMTTTYLGK